MDMFQGRMDIAVAHGADVAIFVHNLVYWVEKNAANGKHFHDGRYWTYNSTKALCEMYPLWTKDQLRHIVKKAEAAGLVLTGNYNAKPMDRTLWYSPSDEVLVLYGLGKYAKCISQNSQMEVGESQNAFWKNPTAIPSIYQEDTKDNPPNPPEGDGAQPAEKPKGKRRRKAKAVPEWRPEKFEGFWASYPRDEDRARAVEQWDALPEDKALIQRHGGDEEKLLREIALGLKRHLASEDWKAGIGIPYAFRWLRDRRWTEKAKTGAPESPPPLSLRKYHTEMIDGEEVVIFDDEPERG